MPKKSASQLDREINGVWFGQERTAKEHRERAEWERDQAAQLRVQKQPVGYEHIAQGHEDAARDYEKRAREIQEDMVTTSRRGEARGKSRAELVNVARAAAAAVFASRKVAPSDAALKKARSAAFKAIQRHDRLAGTSAHPVAAYAHGIAELAAEATEEARQRWEMQHESLRKLRRSHSTVKSSEPIYTLSADQLKALRTFAKANGRSWKFKLNDAWMTGRYQDYNGTDDYGSLQQIRNRFGPAWLVKFSFDRAKTHSVKR